MSYSLKYYPDPGIAFDISKMLFVKLNPETVWKEFLITMNSPIDEVSFIQDKAKYFPEVNSDLLLFSFIPNNKNETFLSRTISQLLAQGIKEFSIFQLQNYFTDISSVQKDLYRFYLGEKEFSMNNMEYTIRSHKALPDRIKLLLFGFIMSPEKFITLLL